MKEINHVVIMSSSSQNFWCLRIDHHQPENCALADHIPWDTPPYLAFKNALLKPFRDLGVLKHEPPVLLVLASLQ